MIGRSASPWPGVGRQAGDCFVVCTVTLFCVHSDMIMEWSCLRLHHDCRVVFFFFIVLSIYFLVVLGLCCCAGFSLVVASGGSSLIVVHGSLIVVASLVAEHGL